MLARQFSSTTALQVTRAISTPKIAATIAATTFANANITTFLNTHMSGTSVYVQLHSHNTQSTGINGKVTWKGKGVEEILR
jgi:hypothetical protein